MESLYKKYKDILEEQAAPAGSGDTRKSALGKLALYAKRQAKRQAKVQEYEEAVANINAAFSKISNISQDPELVAYAQELWDNRDRLNPQAQAIYETLINWGRTASPFNHINTEDEDEDPFNQDENE